MKIFEKKTTYHGCLACFLAPPFFFAPFPGCLSFASSSPSSFGLVRLFWSSSALEICRLRLVPPLEGGGDVRLPAGAGLLDLAFFTMVGQRVT